MVDNTFNDMYHLPVWTEEERQRARLAVAARARSNDDCALILMALGL